MNKKILIASLVTLASVAATVGVVGSAHKVNASNIAANTYIYFEIPEGWDSAKEVDFMIGHSSWSQGYKMTKLSNVDIYYVNMPKWDGYTEYAFFLVDSTWGGEGNKLSNRKSWARASTNILSASSGEYVLQSGKYNLLGGDAVQPYITKNSSSHSGLNLSITANAEEGGTATVSGYSLSSVTATSAVSGTTASILKYTDATLTATVNDGYEFVGWYDGETQIATELSHTIKDVYEAKTYTAKFNKVAAEEPEAIGDLLGRYYNEGTYTRHTVINLSEAAKVELAKYWHAGSNLLERTTYFDGDSLWMTNEKTEENGTYSYYGTKYDGETPVGVTGGRVELNTKTESVVLSGEGKESMEAYYTTLNDIMNNTAEWSYEDGVYSTEDSDVVKMFLDFTAPCLYDVTEDNANYLAYAGVQVQETGLGLELRLLVSDIDAGKLAVENGVLSTATITYEA